MRQLHSVSVREAFVASGVYTVYEGGHPNGVVERWSIHQLPDRSKIARVDYDARKPFGRSILLESLLNPVGRIERFDIAYYHDGESPVKRAKASYTLFDNRVEIGRTLDNGKRIDESLNLPSATVIYPFTYIFTGTMIKQVALHDGAKVSIFYPDLASSNPTSLLQGQIDSGMALFIKREAVEVSGKQVETNIYQFSAGFYPEEGRFWLNERDFLVQVVYKYNAHEQGLVLLTQYAHRP